MTLKAPHIQTEIPGPKSRALVADEQRHLAPGLQGFALSSGIAVERAQGSVIEDVDGNRYVDLIGGIGVNSLGHCHPAYTKALHEQIDKVTVGSFTSAPRAELINEIAKLTPKGVDLARDQLKHQSSGSVAAVIMEPLQGTAGNVVPPPEFMQRAQEIAKENGAVFISDEMITGFGRTGRWFACERSGVTPDVITIGKGFGSGFPITGIVAKDELVQAKPWANPSGSSSSYGGNPLAAAAALASVRTVH